MPGILEADLKKQLAAKRFSNVYLLYGDEKYLIKHYSSLIIKKSVPADFADFNLHVFDGKSADFDEIGNAAEALPMFSEYNCIHIKDMQLDSLNSETAQRLTDLISDVSESTIIMFSMPNCEVNMKSPKGKKILALFEKYGTAVNFSHPDRRQLAKLIEKGAGERACQFSYAEADYLVSLVGDDMTTVLNELEKICAYKKQGKITTQDIDAVVVKSVQARAFDLAKALMADNCDKAMSILDNLFYLKEEPINILAAIITPYVDLYRAKVYIAGGLRAQDAAADFNYKNKEFRLTNAARSASKYSMAQLRDFLDVLYDADRLLKTTSLNGRLVLEQTITKFLLIANGEKI